METKTRDGFQYDEAYDCALCVQPVRRGIAIAIRDGNGEPIVGTRSWRHDGFPIGVHARSTIDVMTISIHLHEQNDAPAGETVEAEVLAEFVSIPAEDWQKIEAVLRAADDVWSRSVWEGNDFSVDEFDMKTLSERLNELPEKYAQVCPVIDAGGAESAETTDQVSEAISGGMGAQEARTKRSGTGDEWAEEDTAGRE